MLVRMVRHASATIVAVTMMAAPLTAQQAVKLPARDKPLTERPATVFSVGAEEGESWELFSGIRSVSFDRSDNLYVLDGQNARVVVFDAAGRFVREFGRRGSGPGELQAPVHLVVTTDGSIVVNDLANRAYVVFKPTGEHVRNVPFAADGFPTSVVADPRGGLITRVNSRTNLENPTAPATSSILRQPLDEKAATTTLASYATAPPRVVQTSGSGVQQRINVTTDPVFGPRATFGVLPDGGIALHTDSEYAIRIFDGAGRHVRTINRDYTPRKVTKRDQDAYEERRRQAQASGNNSNTVVITMGGGADAPRAQMAAGAAQLSATTTFADYMSVVTSVRADPAGRLWVQRRQADGTERGPIDLIDATGRYIGTLPAQQAPSVVSASGLAAYVVTDDLGVERVVVRRLPASWR